MQEETPVAPKHPNYSLETSRLSSYSQWSPASPQNPVVLCDAGFFYTGFGDCVRCFSCGVGLRNWEDGDTPWIEHARWNPNCKFLKQRKGDLFIEMHRHDRNQEEHFAPFPQSPPHYHQLRQDAFTETSPTKSSTDSENEIAIRSVQEMGYSKSRIESATKELRKQGKSKYFATEIMEVILDQDEGTASRINASHCPIGSERKAQSSNSSDSVSLINENQALKKQMQCKICLDNDACIVYPPCGHMVTCQNCAPTIRKCCICRKFIQGTVKAYL